MRKYWVLILICLIALGGGYFIFRDSTSIPSNSTLQISETSSSLAEQLPGDIPGGSVRSLPIKWSMDTSMEALTCSDDTIYIGSGARISALDVETGRLKASFAMPKEDQRPPWRIDRLPCVFEKKVFAVYRSVSQRKTSIKICALDSESLDLKWERTFPNSLTESWPVVHDGILYFSPGGSSLFALDIDSGKTIKQYGTDLIVWGGPVFHNDLLIFSTIVLSEKRVMVLALDIAAGKEKWRNTEVGFVADVGVGYEDYYVCGSTDENVYAIDSFTGKIAWKFPTGAEITSELAVIGDTVLCSNKGGFLYAVEGATGEELWKFLGGKSLSPLTIVGDIVFVSDELGVVYGVDLKSGVMRIKTVTESSWLNQPILCGDSLVVGEKHGKLYALALDDYYESRSKKKADWLKGLRNDANAD